MGTEFRAFPSREQIEKCRWWRVEGRYFCELWIQNDEIHTFSLTELPFDRTSDGFTLEQRTDRKNWRFSPVTADGTPRDWSELDVVQPATTKTVQPDWRARPDDEWPLTVTATLPLASSAEVEFRQLTRELIEANPDQTWKRINVNIHPYNLKYDNETLYWRKPGCGWCTANTLHTDKFIPVQPDGETPMQWSELKTGLTNQPVRQIKVDFGGGIPSSGMLTIAAPLISNSGMINGTVGYAEQEAQQMSDKEQRIPVGSKVVCREEDYCKDYHNKEGILIKDDGTGRPYLVEYPDNRGIWWLASSVKLAPAVKASIPIGSSVLCDNDINPACIPYNGKIGILVEDDVGHHRRYKVKFPEGITLWWGENSVTLATREQAEVKNMATEQNEDNIKNRFMAALKEGAKRAPVEVGVDKGHEMLKELLVSAANAESPREEGIIREYVTRLLASDYGKAIGAYVIGELLHLAAPKLGKRANIAKAAGREFANRAATVAEKTAGSHLIALFPKGINLLNELLDSFGSDEEALKMLHEQTSSGMEDMYQTVKNKAEQTTRR